MVVYSYFGFGDHCIAFGIIKEFAKQHDKIIYRSDWMSHRNFENCVRLYSSIPNVELIEEAVVPYETPTDFCIAHTKVWFEKMDPWLKDNSLLKPEWFNDSWIFDRQWYANAHVPFKLKWDNFYFERDMKKEKEVFYNIIGLKDNEEFIFLQEDLTRNILIDRKYIKSDIKIIESSKLQNVSILDMLYVIENAKEVHVINSAFLTFIDLINIHHKNLNYHKYSRDWFWDQPALRLKWNIIS